MLINLTVSHKKNFNLILIVRNIIISILLFLTAINANAQFYSAGDDPASIKWNCFNSPNFKMIYPQGIDSLAKRYAFLLEKYRPAVSRSSGFLPGEYWLGRTPVVLHAYNAVSNGSVAIAPYRMDFFTSPQAYSPEPMPWMKMLSIHESRHAAQMQFAYSNVFRPFFWIFGEMFPGLMTGLYPDLWLLEGDAVVAETALTNSGRGRVANFLNYYKIAFDNGDFRSVDRWAYGSYKHYTPDHYAYGYMTVSGFRTFYDYPLFMRDMLYTYSKRPYNLFTRNTVSKRITGKNFRKASRDIFEMYHDMWSEEMKAKKQNTYFTRLTKYSDSYTEYTDNLLIDGTLYSLKESFDKPRRLVSVNSLGNEKIICSFGSEVGMLYHSPALNRLFWSETVPGKRWTQEASSVIRYMDLNTMKKKTLTQKGILFNPNPSPTEGHIAVTEYRDNGRSFLTILNGISGEKEICYAVPDTLQLVEKAWIGNTVYATAVSNSGYGIYHLHVDCLNKHDETSEIHNHNLSPYIHDGEQYFWETTLAPSPVMIFNFGANGENLSFTSDHSGTDEIYFMNPYSGKIYQQTSTKYGVLDFTVSDDGEFLYCSQREHNGIHIVYTPYSQLLNKEINWSERYVYKIADKLSAQEQKLTANEQVTNTDINNLITSEPKRYRKFPHLFNIHSWAPVYFNVDNIRNASYDHGYEMGSLGAAAVIQNRLGTFSANFGYSAHKDPYNRKNWRHSGHIDLVYSGLYPVIEANIDINDRAARVTSFINWKENSRLNKISTSSAVQKPYINGNISVYIPINLSSGGWSRGIIPRISWGISNDRIDSGEYLAYIHTDASTSQKTLVPFLKTNGKETIRQHMSGSIRMYIVRSTAHAEIYPEWGIGGEIGVLSMLGPSHIYGPAGYAYLYGYIPGITGNQGLRLSAKYQHQFRNNTYFYTGAISTLPRGFADNEALSQATANVSNIALTADYAIPFHLGDFNIGNLFYVNRGILTPHFDYSFLGKEQLFSVGATLEIAFGNFLGLAFPTTFGVTYSYNAGKSFHNFAASGIDCGRHFVGPVFNMSF